MDATDWTSSEIVLAGMLGFGALWTLLSNRPAAMIAGFFARPTRGTKERRRD